MATGDNGMASIAHSIQNPPSDVSPPLKEVALAFAVVRSKPPLVLIREYVLQLRKHIQGGSRNHPTKSSHSYVDSATFWKDACNEAIAAQAELKARIDELERVNDILSSKLKPADKPGFELANGKRRKKRADSRTAVVRRSEGQKQVRSQSSESSIELDVAELEAYSDAAENRLFMGRLYGFHRLLQDESLDPHKLSSAIIDVCSAATAIVSFASKSFEPQTRPGSSNAAFPSPGQEFIASFSNEGPNVAFGTLFRTLARTFVNLLQGFGKLNKTTESRKYQGQLTYSFVKLFGDTLASLHTVSVIQTQSQARQDIRPPTDKGQAETTHQSDPKTTNNDTNLYIHLSQLLVTMIAALDLAKPHHINILEGFFYLLLQRVGKILYTFVFNEEESPILASRNAEQENLQTHGIEATRNEASKTRAMHVEAKHLIWILERAMSFVHRQQVIPPPRKPPKSKIKNPSTTITPTLPNRHSAKPTLSEHAKTRLQNTLLKGVFGVDSEEFKNGLKMPTRAEMDLDMDLPTVAEEDVAEWFKGEVWRLVGWEILGEHVDM